MQFDQNRHAFMLGGAAAASPLAARAAARLLIQCVRVLAGFFQRYRRILPAE
jgi:hypothetical protein